ncbi:uncharacterized protein LOC110117688 [Ceratitis capitata]|uniref:uncharacterized protein LOC110117688 n=1 Tax=Ceratitis capitata TaxID=7213 RepID=UPI000A1015CD|nr:uncharacterized protein LOC110117688 [Ceratitis capitata]
MASDVLAVALAIALLVSNAYASKNIENVYAHSDNYGNYGNLNDTTSFTWQDLRNEIHQGDAVTYELGAPQYQILNADEPIEIITPDQPGYYESLKRYEQAAEQTASQMPEQGPAEKLTLDTTDSTTVAPDDARGQRAKDKNDKQTLSGDKKIRFIILNSKKKSKNSKIYIDLTKNKQQGTFVAGSLKNDVNEVAVGKSKSVEKSTDTQQTDWKNELPLQNSFNAIKQKQNSSTQTNTTEETTNLDETTPINIAENMTNPPISHKGLMVMEAPAHAVAMPTANIPIEMSLPTAPMLQEFLRPDDISSTFPGDAPMLQQFLRSDDISSTFPGDAPMLQEFLRPDDISSTFPGDAPAEPHAAGVRSNLPLHPALPHIRDFEYLYRSALGLR